MDPAAPDLTHAQLFLDDTWIEESAFVTRRWHQPRKHPGPVLLAEHPWEHWCPVLYGTVLRQEDRFRMWYKTWRRGPLPSVCYAESRDGVVWEKPRLGLCEFEGRTDNNIVLTPCDPKGLIDDITVIEDPGDREAPLKALFWDSGGDKKGAGIFAARSKDGLRWDRSPGCVLPGWGDRFNGVSSRIDGKFVLFGRAPNRDAERGRRVWRTESEDLSRWSDPVLVLDGDVEDPAAMEYYSLSAFPYADLMLGAIERMYKSPDKLDAEIVWSRDAGVTWSRARTRPSFIPWGAERSFDDTWINLPTNAPIRHQGRLWFYYSGRSAAHGAPYPLNQGGVGLALLRIDGFASIQAQEKAGGFATPPMPWPAADLHVNVDPRRDLESHPGFETGEASVEVRDEAKRPIAGFGFEDCVPLRKNSLNADDASVPVGWKEGRSMAALAGRRVRLAFRLRDAHLFSFRAGAVVK